jgi:hypothetical protein
MVLTRPGANYSSVKKSGFHAREKVMKSRIWMFHGGWELI